MSLTGHETERLANNVSVVIEGVEGGDLVAALDLDGVEVSTGSACTSGSTEPSHVLLAMGIEPELAHGSIRITTGPETTAAEVDRALETFHAVLPRLRASQGDGRQRMSRIVAAMSGGVDSSVAAALLAREAATDDEVIGVWMRTHADLPEGYELSRSCCSPDAADDARRVAQILGIPFFVLNVEREFGARVIDAFVDAYLDGATPNPCQACNQYIKFDELLRRGLAAYGADAVATGHYARVEHREGRWRLLRAADAAKDQTYFLWVLDQEQLSRTRFPLGELTKPEVRAMAADLTLPTAQKPESQEICFVPLGDYRTLLEERRGLRRRPGTDRRRRRHRDRHAHRLRALHRRPAPWTGRGPRRGGLRSRGPAGVPTRSSSAAATRWPSARSASMALASRPANHRGSASTHRSGSGIGRRTCRPRSRWSATTGSSWRRPSRSGRRLPARRAVLYDGDECLGGGRIARAEG